MEKGKEATFFCNISLKMKITLLSVNKIQKNKNIVTPISVIFFIKVGFMNIKK